MFSTSRFFNAPIIISAPTTNYFIGLLGNTSVAENAYGVTVDSSGNSYICGTSVIGTSTYIEIAKYDSLGAIVWQKNIGTSGSTNTALSIAVDSSSNIYLCGSTYNYNAQSDILTIKLDSSGTILWQKALNFNDVTNDLPDYGTGVAVDSSSNVYICGQSEFPGQRAFYIAKYNSSGVIQWQRRAAFLAPDMPMGITVDISGNVHVCGSSVDGDGVTWQELLKYSSAGVLAWKKRLLGDFSIQEAKGVAVDSSSNVFLCGYTSDGTNNSLTLVKYNSAGTIVWMKQLGDAGFDDVGTAVSVDSGGNIYVCGYTNASGTNRMLIVKYNTSGIVQWQTTLGSSADTRGYGISVDASNNIYVSGTSFANGSADILIAKLPANGSKTGTYTVGGYSFTYTTSSLTAATAPLYGFNSGLTSANATLDSIDPALGSTAASTLTSSITLI